MSFVSLPLVADPGFLPKAQSGTKAQGLAYEKKVGKVLSAYADTLGWEFHNHPWLQTGTIICQPDFLLIAPSGCILIVETKLTSCDCATQLRRYKKVLKSFPTTTLQIAKRVVTKSTVDCLDNTIDNGLMLLWL